MRQIFQGAPVKFYIGDVRARESLLPFVAGADHVFHAAALKIVPSCEFFPGEAVATNVLGSNNVLQAASDAGVESAVFLSTDKAVLPINAMGMTKALMEKSVQAWARNNPGSLTRVSIVRYGNVMFSRGSVIPLFISLMKKRMPLTITEASMTRFMMPLSEAVDLVEFAMLNAEGGDLFIRKAPACTIGDLAVALIELFESSSEVRSIGFRHGEKLYETLATAEELRRSEDLGDYLRIPLDDRSLDYGSYFTEGDPTAASSEDFNSHNALRLDLTGIKDLLRAIPEISEQIEGLPTA